MSRWRIYEKGMGKQRLLALQNQKCIVSGKGGNYKEKKKRGRWGVRRKTESKAVRMSEIQGRSSPMHELFSYF